MAPATGPNAVATPPIIGTASAVSDTSTENTTSG